jgi:hypothetical protein
MTPLWGPQPTHWSQAYSFWKGHPIVLGWIGPSFVILPQFRAHLGPPRVLVPPPPLISEGLLGLQRVLTTWSIVLAYGSSWVPSEIPKKWMELTRSFDTTWCTPKFLIRPKKGPTMSKSGSSWNLVSLLASNTKGGERGMLKALG